MKLRGKFVAAVAGLMGCVALNAAEPTNYYNSCENKGGQDLLKALFAIVGPHTAVGYDGLWEVYKTSDVRDNGKVWDMYSTKEWTVDQNQCGNYHQVGDCYNREHSVPKSWFNDASPMVSDAFHIYPTDGAVNGQRGNHPYGECSRGTTLASNGSVKALGRLGNSTFGGYTKTVFEPDDQYKGDFARSYFYMAAAYNDRISGWDSDMFAGNSYPAFSDWTLELLLKWHRQDPVSDKELKRNDAVYAHQKNRNPFIDHPEMVEYIWGDKKTEKWSRSEAAKPTLLLPVNNSTVDFGAVGVGRSRSFALTVKGTSLTSSLMAGVTDATGTFTVSPAVLTADRINLSTGTDITVTVNAKAGGDYTATLLLISTADNIRTSVTLKARAIDGLPVAEASDVTDESFTARWTYVGDEDPDGCYTLHVTYADGTYVDGYPRRVPAADEAFVVDNLNAATDYVYYVSNNTLTSAKIAVTTAEPIPDIQILYDGELYLTGEPGVPSAPCELLLDIQNIFEDIVLTVTSPFELSVDKSAWATSLTIDPREDRIYIRINGSAEGSYTTTLRASAGSYVNDNTVVGGAIFRPTTFFEDFEAAATGNYTTTTVKGTATTWTLGGAGVYNMKNEAFDGNNYLRFNDKADSYAFTSTPVQGGVGTVTLQAAGWSAKDGSTKFKLQYSTDGGTTWTDAGAEIEIPAPASSTITYKEYRIAVNQSGPVNLRIQQTYGKRMCIDNIEATNYTSSVDDSAFGNDRGDGWDAYSRDGRLIVESTLPADVAIHGMDGRTYAVDTVAAGQTAYPLPAGLYIVVIGQSTRRVLVK